MAAATQSNVVDSSSGNFSTQTAALVVDMGRKHTSSCKSLVFPSNMVSGKSLEATVMNRVINVYSTSRSGNVAVIFQRGLDPTPLKSSFVTTRRGRPSFSPSGIEAAALSSVVDSSTSNLSTQTVAFVVDMVRRPTSRCASLCYLGCGQPSIAQDQSRGGGSSGQVSKSLGSI
jgi:hypothetical protein